MTGINVKDLIVRQASELYIQKHWRQGKPVGEKFSKVSICITHNKVSLLRFISSLNQVCLNNLFKKKKKYTQFGGLDVFGCSLDSVAVLGGKLGDELQQGGALVLHRLSVAAEQRLVLSGEDVDACLQLWQAIPNVVHQQPETGKSAFIHREPRSSS